MVRKLKRAQQQLMKGATDIIDQQALDARPYFRRFLALAQGALLAADRANAKSAASTASTAETCRVCAEKQQEAAAIKRIVAWEAAEMKQIASRGERVNSLASE